MQWLSKLLFMCILKDLCEAKLAWKFAYRYCCYFLNTKPSAEDTHFEISHVARKEVRRIWVLFIGNENEVVLTVQKVILFTYNFHKEGKSHKGWKQVCQKKPIYNFL